MRSSSNSELSGRELEICHGGSIYTIGIDKCYQSGTSPPLEDSLLKTYQHTTAYLNLSLLRQNIMMLEKDIVISFKSWTVMQKLD